MTTLVLLIISLLSVVVFARPPQLLCCDQTSDCVIWKHCVNSGTFSYDVYGDGDKDYCLNNEWWDCGSAGNSAGCDFVDNGHGIDVAAYCGGSHDCVAKKNNCAACSNGYECLGGSCTSGKCRASTTESDCSNGLDDDCDGLTDCQGAGDPDCGCCGGENAECCSGDTCNSGLYCSKVNPTTGASVDPHCCDNSPVYWWNPAIIDDEKCTQVGTCTPCSNPFDPSCTPAGLYGCCPFLDIYTDRIITTY